MNTPHEMWADKLYLFVHVGEKWKEKVYIKCQKLNKDILYFKWKNSDTQIGQT